MVRKVLVLFSPYLDGWFIIVTQTDNSKDAYMLAYEPTDEELQYIYGKDIIIIRSK